MSTTLRLRIVNEEPARADELVAAAAALGHQAEPMTVRALSGLAPATAQQPVEPEVLIVGRQQPDLALELVASLARRPPLVVLASSAEPDGAFVGEAVARGACGYVTSTRQDALQAALAFALAVQEHRARTMASFERRFTIEQAKGILMVQHGVGPEQAFDLLRRQSQRSNRKVAELARAVCQSHSLLLERPAVDGDEAPALPFSVERTSPPRRGA